MSVLSTIPRPAVMADDHPTAGAQEALFEVGGADRLRTTADLLAAAASLPWLDDPTQAASTRSASDRSASTRSASPRQRSPRPGVMSQTAIGLLDDARRELDRALGARSTADRYSAAHLAALRAASAVLATRATPARGRRGSAWTLLARVAPGFGEWAAFFAAGSAKRQAAQAGITRLITDREASDMVRQSAMFIDLVADELADVGDRKRRA